MGNANKFLVSGTTILLLIVTLLFPARSIAVVTQSAPPEKIRSLKISMEPRQQDFDAMLKHRVIRIAVPFSRTLYYIDKGQAQGLTAELIHDFERYLNRKYKKQLKRTPLTIYTYPLTRDKLLQAVVDGKVDIAAGNLTITERREAQADFVPLADGGINEVLVSVKGAPQIDAVEDLSGRTVHVRPSTSYHESLLELNARLIAAGREPVTVITLPDAIEDEDKLEMLNAGMFDFVIMDNWKARIWAQLLPNISVHEKIVLRSETRIGWAIRKNSPLLQKELALFLTGSHRQLKAPHQYKRLMKRVKELKNNTSSDEIKKFNRLLTLFEKYGQKYSFDPLLLTALGYQESRLNQNARSHVGAVGIMQLMPRTGSAMRVGSIRVTESNIHAGSKYLDLLMDQYFSDADFSEQDRSLFAFAAYNAGPGNIAKMRKEAGRRGLDPNVWFNNVEIVTADRIGSEPVSYVRNIFKYYTAYKLIKDRQRDREKARSAIEAGLQ